LYNHSSIEAASQKNASKSEDYFADFDFDSFELDVKSMLKSGVHFGHQKAKKKPKMSEYVFGVRNGINIIDLEKSYEKIEEAGKFLSKIVSEGKEILFVGTKKQAKDIVKSAAKRCEMPYVVERWLGGTFTNFKVIAGRTKYLKDMQDKMKKGELSKYTKFEQMKIAEELEKMENKMGGIKYMKDLPGAIFVTGVIEDNLAIKEALNRKIPIVAIADTNVNPNEIDFPIPANDDAVSSLKLIMAYVCKKVLEGKKNIAIVPVDKK